MKRITFDYKNSLISEKELKKTLQKLNQEIERMNAARKKAYDDDRASINLLGDLATLSRVKMLIEEKKKLNPKYLIVVGIGGSNLGTIAIQEAILGRQYNQLKTKIKVLYADTVDSDLIQNIISIVEPELQKGENILINGISKSGGTTETIANFEVLIDLLKKYKKNYEKYVVVTTDENSKFWSLAKEKGFSLLKIPKKVGGRYSVFSPVGLFPLGLLGIDIEELLKGAKLIRDQCLNIDSWKNPATLSASLIYLHAKQKKNIHDLFLFSTDLESIGKWYRQLMGESIGKEYNIEYKQVFNGITPTVSIGSTDLHSMAQLYLGGPYDKFTSFVSIEKNNSSIILPNYQKYSRLVKGMQGIKMSKIMNAIYVGVKTAFRKGKRPFIEIVLPDKSPSSIGQLLQLKMMEMMYLGFLLKVNPFDQPNVESYKIETRKILEGEEN